jgi:hypothetical protein
LYYKLIAYILFSKFGSFSEIAEYNKMKVSFACTVVLLCFLLGACDSKQTLFQLVSSKQSGINFNNLIVENDSINPIDVTNIYNGGGVGIGDFNNDGLSDIYFTAGQVSNKLYLNKGNFRFEDVTDVAKVSGEGKWSRGVAVVDINNDGLQDIYVCTTIYADSNRRTNLLYINNGPGKNGIPVFTEMSKEYGLNDNTYSTMAAFFDYDNDRDLDVYITVNEISIDNNPSEYRDKIVDGSFPSTGRLYRNDWNTQNGHPYFTNVTKEARVTIEGYGHGATIADFNRDGWKDIFVTNDFLSNDLLYINNGNGTFTDKASIYFKHTSANGMGQDVIDINNDGLSDVIELDMDPEDNFRKKLLMSGYNYSNYQNNDRFGYQYQYVRNSLQLNMGAREKDDDSIADPIFGDVGFYAGISSTDWSWTPLVQDFDNDGFRDIIVTNGFPKDLTDHDFIAFREKSFISTTKSEVLSKIPQVKISNYAFRNKGNVTFSDETVNWGMTIPSFSNGAAYADLDNDGDLDVVINNINNEAFVYRNMENKKDAMHYIAVKLVGDSMNINGTGSWVEIYYDGKQQVYEQTPYRGYLSSVETKVHFGLGDETKIDSLVVRWPDLRKQVVRDVKINTEIIVEHKHANETFSWKDLQPRAKPLFRDITDSSGLTFTHNDVDFIDFNIQRLLPHKLSEYGPPLVTADLNGDGLDDMIVGASHLHRAVCMMQQNNGTFTQKELFPGKNMTIWKDAGLTILDADGDGDQDLYACSGGYESQPYTAGYQDRLYINDGAGNFTADTSALPKNFTSKSCVRAADFDHDGDADLFIGGRVFPWNFPKPVSSYVFRNDSKSGKIKFTDVTESVAPSLSNIGMVCDGMWTDFDNDGWVDLILAGEWMPLKFIKNEKGKFSDVSSLSGVNQMKGWWNAIASADFDKDGDVDYVVSNLGSNSYYKASEKYPVSIYANDFYKSGAIQCVITQYFKNRVGGTYGEYTAHTRDDVVEQFPFLKKRFLTYKAYGTATFDKLFTPEEMKSFTRFTANYFLSSFVRNEGNGKFSLEPLPGTAQYSAINGMVADDFDGDGNIDVCMNTNDFGTEPANGRYDALNGLILKGDGKGGFTPLSVLESGIYLPGNGRALVKLKSSDGGYLLAASENKGPVRLFRMAKN